MPPVMSPPPFSQVIVTTTEFGTTINGSFGVGAPIGLTLDLMHNILEDFREMVATPSDEEGGGGESKVARAAETDDPDIEHSLDKDGNPLPPAVH